MKNIQSKSSQWTRLRYLVIAGLIVCGAVLLLRQYLPSTPGPANDNTTLADTKAVDTREFLKTIYLSPGGKDSASGDLNDPIASLGQAMTLAAKVAQPAEAQPGQDASRAKAGVRIVLRDGRYELSEPLVIDQTGLGPLTIEAYPNEKPVLSGGVRLPNTWTVENVNGREVWSQILPEVAAGKWYFRQLWVNGQRATVPVIPKNNGFLQIKDLIIPEADRGKEDAWQYSAKNEFIFNPGDFNKDWHALDDVYVIPSYSWYHAYLTIKEIVDQPENDNPSVEGVSKFTNPNLFSPPKVIFNQEISNRPFLVAHPAHGRFVGEDLPGGHNRKTFYEPAYYRIYNVFEALSEPGEFYLDRKTGKLTYLPRPGEKSGTAEVVAPRIKQLLHVKGAPGKWIDNLVLDGLTFSYTEVAPEKHVGTGNNFQTKDQAVVRLEAVRQSTIKNCEFSHLGETALDIIGGSRDIDVVGNNFYDLGSGAIDTMGDFGDRLENARITPATTMRLRITDNHIRKGGRMFPGHTVMNINKARNCVIAFNEISDFFFSGIHVGGRSGRDLDFSVVDNQVLNNYIHHLGQGHWTGNDIGAIYANGVGLGVMIEGNVIHDINCTIYGGSGIYLDATPCHFTIRNNLIYNSNYEGLHIKGFNNLIENNIVYNTWKAFGQPTNTYVETPVAVLRHNIFVPTSAVVYISKFADPMNFNFRSENNLIWSLDAGSAVLVARKGDLGVKYASTMSFEAWREKTGFDQGSVIAPVKFKDPAKGDFQMDPATSEKAKALGFVPFEIKAGPRPAGERTLLPFRPDNEAINSPAFKQHVEWVLPEWEKAKAERDLARKDKEFGKKKLEEKKKAETMHVQ